MARIGFFTFWAISYCFFYQSVSFWPNWTISKPCAHLIKSVCYFYKSKKVRWFFLKNRGFLGFSAFLQISFLTYPQNPLFFVSSFQVRLKYGLYQFSNWTLTYRAQNPQNRVQKSLFSIFSFFPTSKSNFFGCILSHMVHIWSVPIFSPDFDI